MHVLGTPPAFTLSQDQTLHHEEFGPLRDSLFYKFVPKGIMCLENAPTEVLFTPLTIPYFWHAYLQIFIPDFHLRNVSAPLCSCSGAQSHSLRLSMSCAALRDIKKPESHSGLLGIPPQTLACRPSVCCPFSRLLSHYSKRVRLSVTDATRNISASACAGHPDWQRPL